MSRDRRGWEWEYAPLKAYIRVFRVLRTHEGGGQFIIYLNVICMLEPYHENGTNDMDNAGLRSISAFDVESTCSNIKQPAILTLTIIQCWTHEQMIEHGYMGPRQSVQIMRRSNITSLPLHQPLHHVCHVEQGPAPPIPSPVQVTET